MAVMLVYVCTVCGCVCSCACVAMSLHLTQAIIIALSLPYPLPLLSFSLISARPVEIEVFTQLSFPVRLSLIWNLLWPGLCKLHIAQLQSGEQRGEAGVSAWARAAVWRDLSNYLPAISG